MRVKVQSQIEHVVKIAKGVYVCGCIMRVKLSNALYLEFTEEQKKKNKQLIFGMNISIDSDQQILEEDYDENYEPTEEGNKILIRPNSSLTTAPVCGNHGHVDSA